MNIWSLKKIKLKSKNGFCSLSKCGCFVLFLVTKKNNFSQYDLYTKCTEVPDIEALWPYYEGLIDKYIPGQLEW